MQMTDLDQVKYLYWYQRKFRKACLGGAHRVHFEHSLLHDSVTTIMEVPG